MRVTEIEVSAGRVFNHPYESFSNLRPTVQMKATLEAGEDPARAVKELQASAEMLVEQHKQDLLQNLHKLAELAAYDEQVSNLERTIATAQAKLEQLRERERPQIERPLFAQ